jgi:tetratricopeptide (TPR) repeat protein
MPDAEPRNSDPLTQAGRINAEYDALWHRRIPAADLPALAKPPSRSRIRQARELAAQGTRLFRDGKHALALDRLRRSIALDPMVATAQLDLGLACLATGRLNEAIAALLCALDLEPDLAVAHLNLATIFDALGRQDDAEAAYIAGLRLSPSEAWAHARLAQIHLANARTAEAEAAFRAAAAASSQPHGRLYEARAELIAGRHAEAESLVRTAIAADPDCGEAHVILGQIQAEDGRASEAVASFERGISLDPDMAAAWNNLASNRKFSTGDEAMFAQMKTCLDRSNLTAQQRQAVHFALGKAYDDVGDYAAAMAHVDAANRVRGAQVRFDRELLARNVSQVIASSPAGFLDRRPEFGIDDATPILIVGMPRSGTTLVEQILSSHPEVAAGGELGFWSDRSRADLFLFPHTADTDAVRRVAADYLAVLRAVSPDAARVIDKTPFNFFRLGAICQAFPRATIVHCRRHPVDTCLSIFATDFQIQYDFVAHRRDLVSIYREYQRMMAHWRSVLPADRSSRRTMRRWSSIPSR